GAGRSAGAKCAVRQGRGEWERRRRGSGSRGDPCGDGAACGGPYLRRCLPEQNITSLASSQPRNATRWELIYSCERRTIPRAADAHARPARDRSAREAPRHRCSGRGAAREHRRGDERDLSLAPGGAAGERGLAGVHAALLHGYEGGAVRDRAFRPGRGGHRPRRRRAPGNLQRLDDETARPVGTRGAYRAPPPPPRSPCPRAQRHRTYPRGGGGDDRPRACPQVPDRREPGRGGTRNRGAVPQRARRYRRGHLAEILLALSRPLYNQPLRSATRAASSRFEVPVFPIAEERYLRTVPAERGTVAAITATALPTRTAPSPSRSRAVSGFGPPAGDPIPRAGSTARSARCTARIALASSGAGVFLTIKPRAPASNARRTYPGRPKVVTMSDLTSGAGRASSRAVTMASSPGISITRRQTSMRSFVVIRARTR